MTTRTRTSARLLAVVGVLALGAGACDSIAENVTENVAEGIAEQAAGEGVEIDVDENGGNVRIESSEGTLDIGGSDLPEAFPGDLPLPDGHEVMSSMTQGSGDANTIFVTVSAPGAFDDVVAAIESGLGDAGWSVDDTTNMTADAFSSTTLMISKDAWTGNVGVTHTDGETMVAYTLEQGGA